MLHRRLRKLVSGAVDDKTQTRWLGDFKTLQKRNRCHLKVTASDMHSIVNAQGVSAVMPFFLERAEAGNVSWECLVQLKMPVDIWLQTECPPETCAAKSVGSHKA